MHANGLGTESVDDMQNEKINMSINDKDKLNWKQKLCIKTYHPMIK